MYRAPCEEIGYQVPPRNAKSAVLPPIAGPIVSVVSRCPPRMPSAANGTSATSMSAVIESQRSADRRTPSDVPAASSTTIDASAVAYAVTIFARKYERVESGVSRSCRFQPTARSLAMRAPLESTADIVPNEARPTM